MSWLNLLAIVAIGLGLWFKYHGLTIIGCAIAFGLSAPIIYQSIRKHRPKSLSSLQQMRLVAAIAFFISILVGLKLCGVFSSIHKFNNLSIQTDWGAVGAVGLWSGAFGQSTIAIVAVYVSWRQYIISRDLTIEQNRLNRQQNIITQQQTIDNYFQGITGLVLDDNGFLEDWPQERAFAAGRTAAILGSINAAGKARVLRFLSRSKLLTPLQRDLRLNRAILNGNGGYDEDRVAGVRVIDLQVMLAGTDISQTDLRWTDLSDANLIRTNLTDCDLLKANLSRTILYQAKLKNADLKGARFFYGSVEFASPRSRTEPPNYITGEFTGAVVEDVDFTNVRQISVQQRQYCCSWCGETSRRTIPGGCQGIPNRLNSIPPLSSARSFNEDL
jgi:uncharacterized protein YjbI with pentapeptide repeats